MVIFFFFFSSLKSTNAFYLGPSQRRASPYNLTPSFQGTIPVAAGARKLLRTRSTMPGLVEGRCGPGARPGGPGRPQAVEANLHVRLREMSARGGTWISCRNLTVCVNQDSGLSAQVSGEQMRSVFPAVKLEGLPEKRGCPPAPGHIPEGFSLLNRGQPLNI